MVGETGTDDLRFCQRCGAALDWRIRREGEPPQLRCANCDFVPQQSPGVAACAAFNGEPGIVLVRRGEEPGRGSWRLPGTQVGLGESAGAAATRAALEQTGFRISLLGVLDVYSSAAADLILIAYAADVVGGELGQGRQGQEVCAFAPERIPWGELAPDATRAVLRDYLRRFFPRVRVPR